MVLAGVPHHGGQTEVCPEPIEGLKGVLGQSISFPGVVFSSEGIERSGWLGIISDMALEEAALDVIPGSCELFLLILPGLPFWGLALEPIGQGFNFSGIIPTFESGTFVNRLDEGKPFSAAQFCEGLWLILNFWLLVTCHIALLYGSCG
jgi:hypothetical protein